MNKAIVYPYPDRVEKVFRFLICEGNNSFGFLPRYFFRTDYRLNGNILPYEKILEIDCSLLKGKNVVLLDPEVFFKSQNFYLLKKFRYTSSVNVISSFGGYCFIKKLFQKMGKDFEFLGITRDNFFVRFLWLEKKLLFLNKFLTEHHRVIVFFRNTNRAKLVSSILGNASIKVYDSLLETKIKISLLRDFFLKKVNLLAPFSFSKVYGPFCNVKNVIFYDLPYSAKLMARCMINVSKTIPSAVVLYSENDDRFIRKYLSIADKEKREEFLELLDILGDSDRKTLFYEYMGLPRFVLRKERVFSKIWEFCRGRFFTGEEIFEILSGKRYSSVFYSEFSDDKNFILSYENKLKELFNSGVISLKFSFSDGAIYKRFY